MTDVRDLLPKSKYDVENAKMIVAQGYPAAEIVLPELLEWLKDCNWPVSRILEPFLASVGLPLAPFVRNILQTDDEMWKYWILSCIVMPSAEIFEAVQKDVIRIASTSSGGEDEEEVRKVAWQILRHYNINLADAS